VTHQIKKKSTFEDGEKEDWEAMKKALITGIAGQDRSYLSKVLLKKGIRFMA
jgi:hypothetical protein